MALIDKASLLMVPSVYEDGTLYNVLPSGNKAPDETGNHNGYDQTRADFTFSRGSNLSATRINSDGLIEKGRENLLLQSNQLDTTWLIGGGGTGLTLTGGQADKDGGNTAWLIDEVTNDQAIYQVVSTNGVQTFSIYAKAGTNEWMRLGLGGGAFSHAYFDLVNGVLGNTLNVVDSSIEDAGNGWWRCSVTANKSVNAVYVYPSEANNSAGTNGSIYIQDAQLELGLVATDYIETGATTATAGVLENTPRIDYSSGAGALLLEPQRTNLLPHSEYFGAWGLSNATITSNAATSPAGVDNASIYASTNATNYARNIITAANGTYTFSVFAKRIATDEFRMNLSDSVTGEVRYVFNFTDETSTLTKSGGTISGYSADFENYGNGWYRLHITATTNSGTEITAYFETDNETGSFEVWGAQLEAGSYVSSYVPTYGSAATRGADSCSVTGASDILNDSEGTFFVEFEGLGSDTAPYLALSAGGSTANRVLIYESSGINAQIKVGGAIVFQSTTASVSGNVKAAVAYKANDFVLYVNGSQYGTSSTGSTFGAGVLTEVEFDHASAALIGAQIKKSIVFNERLSNTELATLTTL